MKELTGRTLSKIARLVFLVVGTTLLVFKVAAPVGGLLIVLAVLL